MTHLSPSKTISLFFSLALAIFLGGCTNALPVYSSAGKNVQAIRSIPATIEVQQLAGEQKRVYCRTLALGPQSSATFASYLEKALSEEILVAGGAKSNTKFALSGSLKSISVDCGVSSGTWTIDMDISINNQPPFPVKTIHEFGGNFVGSVVMSNAYTGFVPAIQDVISDIIKSEQFQAAIRK